MPAEDCLNNRSDEIGAQRHRACTILPLLTFLRQSSCQMAAAKSSTMGITSMRSVLSVTALARSYLCELHELSAVASRGGEDCLNNPGDEIGAQRHRACTVLSLLGSLGGLPVEWLLLRIAQWGSHR